MSENTQQMYPTFTIAPNDFEKDLKIIKGVFSWLEEMTHTKDGYRLSDSAQLAAGWWFYDVYVMQDFAKKMFETVLTPEMHNTKGATLGIASVLQGQLRKYGSEARIKTHGDVPFATPWWAWLFS